MLERMFTRLGKQMGLFMVGAGASAGLSPLGRHFWLESPLHYLRGVGPLPVIATPQGPLTRRMIDHSGVEIGDIFPGRYLRPGTDEYPFRDNLLHLRDVLARERLKHALARARHIARAEETVTDSYGVFHLFYPSVIANYNHDGLAEEFCGAMHAIVEMHGAIHPLYGSPEIGAWISSLRDLDVALPPDDLIMGLPESWVDKGLSRRLSWVMSKAPRHVAIIGYSFANIGSGFDDAVTLAFFIRKFKHYPVPIFVVSPDPAQLCEMLSDALEINTVYPIACYWNVLAHAYMEMQRDPDKFRSLDYSYGFLLDKHGALQAFSVLLRHG